MMPIVWTESQTLKLVIFYSKYECLRNPFQCDSKNKLCRYKAYKQIVESMNVCGLTVYDCIKRITFIKAQYCYELSKISAAIFNEKSYKPKASWFPIMHEILFPYMKTYGYTDNSWKAHGNGTDTLYNYYGNERSEQVAYPNTKEFKKPPNTKNCGCTYANCYCETSRKSYTHSKKPFLKADIDQVTNLIATNYPHLCSQKARVDIGSCIEKCITKEHETQTDVAYFKRDCSTYAECVEDITTNKYDSKYTTLCEDQKVHDEFDMFGKSIACQLRNINFEVAIKLEKHIQDLITQERLDNINSKSMSYITRSDCCSSSCSDCKVLRKEMICSCGLPMIMIKADRSCEFTCK